MSYEPMDGSSERTTVGRAKVSVWTNGKLAFNQTAWEEWLDGQPAVRVLVHEEKPLAIVEGIEERTEEHDYILGTHGDYDGRIVEARKLLKHLECVRPEEVMELTAEEQEDGGVVVNFEMLT